MRLATVATAGARRLAGWRDGEWIDLSACDPEIGDSMRDLLAAGAAGLERAAAALRRGRALVEPFVWLPPVPDPQKVICIGLNYADHARETGMTPPPEPVVFNKFPSALVGHEAAVRLPALCQEVDYEAELVAVIGQGGRSIEPTQALEHVAGYCCGNDVSARDWQLRKPGKQWLLGKTFDSFAPCGPALVTADEIADPGRLAICLRRNGEILQQSTTAEFLFSIAELVSYVSRVATLVPGDLLFTGTPPGVGMGRKPPVFLQPGDVLEVDIEGVGRLQNQCLPEGE